MNRKRLLIAEPRGFPPDALDRLREVFDVTAADLDRAGLERAVRDVHVLWVRLRRRVDTELLSRARALEIIATPTTGLTHLDLEEIARRGIDVLSLRGETGFLNNVRATAEHTIGLIFSLMRHIPAAAAHVRAGGWDRDLFQGAELFGKTAAVIGYGRLGRIVSRYLAAFECRVFACDPYVALSRDSGVEFRTLDDALPQADVVTLHVNLTDGNRGFYGVREFERMKPGSYFINTSRGELLDEEALLAALDSKRLAGAALDVLCQEDSAGMSGHPLVNYAKAHSNLLITPHIGGCALESMRKTERFLCDKLLRYMASGVPLPGAISAAI